MHCINDGSLTLTLGQPCDVIEPAWPAVSDKAECAVLITQEKHALAVCSTSRWEFTDSLYGHCVSSSFEALLSLFVNNRAVTTLTI